MTAELRDRLAGIAKRVRLSAVRLDLATLAAQTLIDAAAEIETCIAEPADAQPVADGVASLAFTLLRVAKCPECDGCGFTVREIGGCDMDGENDSRECVQQQCQWCFERDGLLAEHEAPQAAPTGEAQP